MTITMHCTDGTPFTIDDADFELVSPYRWDAQRSLSTRTTYARSRLGGSRSAVPLHRLLLSPPEGSVVDHIDGNGLNNVRSNLRVCSRSENSFNAQRRKDNTSGFKGVYWHRRIGKWQAEVVAHRKRNHLGYYDTPEQAAEVARAFREKVHGEFANHG
jgi:AP2 domain/HNH endonuclease